MKILVTGGAGYLGSHVCLALAKAGYQPVLVDRFQGKALLVLDALAKLTPTSMIAERGDLRDTPWVDQLLERHQPACVIHLAHCNGWPNPSPNAFRHMGDNLLLLGSVLKAMEARGIRTLQIASSAEVYGAAPQSVFSENLPRRPVSKAGMYHHLVENMLEALRHSNPSWRVAVLRHFNPSGAHPSGLLGQRGPFMGQPAVLTQLARASSSPVEPLQVCAHQHPTPDGSPVLDLTHVQDIAEAHVAALEAQLDYDEGFSVNVGTGQGHSVLDLIHAFEVGNACKVTWQFAPHRTSGTTRQVANTELALQLMGWRAQHTLTEVCVDAMRWHQTLLREREAVRR